ncbi:MAG: hypothetical protein ABL921_10085 [Pirellula sp.]
MEARRGWLAGGVTRPSTQTAMIRYTWSNRFDHRVRRRAHCIAGPILALGATSTELVPKLHVEYIDEKDPNHIDLYIAAFKNDLETLRKWLAS